MTPDDANGWPDPPDLKKAAAVLAELSSVLLSGPVVPAPLLEDLAPLLPWLSMMAAAPAAFEQQLVEAAAREQTDDAAMRSQAKNTLDQHRLLDEAARAERHAPKPVGGRPGKALHRAIAVECELARRTCKPKRLKGAFLEIAARFGIKTRQLRSIDAKHRAHAIKLLDARAVKKAGSSTG